MRPDYQEKCPGYILNFFHPLKFLLIVLQDYIFHPAIVNNFNRLKLRICRCTLFSLPPNLIFHPDFRTL